MPDTVMKYDPDNHDAQHVSSELQPLQSQKEGEGVLSRFTFRPPPPTGPPATDEDGDPILVRQKERCFCVEHRLSTNLSLVGEQVWRGALFLADYLLHTSDQISAGARVLELASGVGLTSLVAGIHAHTVVVTDLDRGNILPLVRRNMERNKEMVGAEMLVRELDFLDDATLERLEPDLRGVSVIIVADVVYHNPLTDAFFAVVAKLLANPPDKTLLVALEKRYVFTIEDMDTVAPCYEHFLRCLEALVIKGAPGVKVEAKEIKEAEVPQYFHYERNKHLVIWQINSTRR